VAHIQAAIVDADMEDVAVDLEFAAFGDAGCEFGAEAGGQATKQPAEREAVSGLRRV
jgi:hypothetical protein